MNGPNIPSSFPSALHLFACCMFPLFVFLLYNTQVKFSPIHCLFVFLPLLRYLFATCDANLCLRLCNTKSIRCLLLVDWFDPQAVVSLMWSSPIPKGNSQFRLRCHGLVVVAEPSRCESSHQRQHTWVCQFRKRSACHRMQCA